MTLLETFQIHTEVHKGGEWLAKARCWLQSNVRDGDTLAWNSAQPVSVPFSHFEEYAMVVAQAVLTQERERVAKLSKGS
jgi:hypothetical protein